MIVYIRSYKVGLGVKEHRNASGSFSDAFSKMIIPLHQKVRTLAATRWLSKSEFTLEILASTSRVLLAEGDKESEAGTGMCVRCGHS